MPDLKELTLLYVDDDAYFRHWMHDCLSTYCGRVVCARNGEEALERLSRSDIDLVLTDIYMPEMDGLALTEKLRDLSPALPVVLHTAFTDIPLLIRGIELGVAGFVQKPPDETQLVATLKRAAVPVVQRRSLASLEKELLLSLEHMLGRSERLKAIGTQTARIAATDYPVLVEGETGTGKSRLARIIHDLSRRAKGPFITVQLGSIPEALIAAELFGHEKGAFTGADQKRQGLVAAANGGTLFLDDVDAAPIGVQALLLQLAEEKTFCRLGSNTPLKVDARIIAASNRGLAAEAQKGTFRRDLYFRLAGLLIELPPLRTIHDDLPTLVESFLLEACNEMGRTIPAVQPEAMSILKHHPWPGNIRELRHVVQRSAVVAERTITAAIVSAAVGSDNSARPDTGGSVGSGNETNIPFAPPPELPLTMAAVEKWALQRALASAAGRKMVAARLLDMNYYTFRRHLAQHGLESESPDT